MSNEKKEMESISELVLIGQVTVDSVVQINENGQDGWIGCLVQVSETKAWGIQGYVQLPMQGAAYIRLKWNQIEYVGQATMTPKKDDL
jgi:hypothetical protein